MEMRVYYLVRIKDNTCSYSAGPFATFEEAEELRLSHRWTSHKYTVMCSIVKLEPI